MTRPGTLAAPRGASGSPWKPFAERKHDRAAKREAVLRTAARIFTENGFRRTSLDDVARLLHVTKPTLYHYFANKEELLYECFRQGLAELELAYRDVRRNPMTGRDRLVIYLRRYAEIIMSSHGACLARVRDDELGPVYRDRIKRLKAGIDRRIRRLVDEGIRDGSIARSDVKLCSFALAGAINWTAQWFKSGGPLRASEVSARFTELFVSGLAPRPAVGRARPSAPPARRS